MEITRSPEYISALHDYECAAQPCASRDITASHPRTCGGGGRLGGKPGKGQRSLDSSAYPLCRRHHGQAQRYEFSRGFFAGWSMKEFATWEAEQGSKYYTRFLAEQEAVAAGTAPEDVTRAALRRKGFDPGDFAARFCAEYGHSDQVRLHLARDLKRELREGGVPL
jgi:hypothetical protein